MASEAKRSRRRRGATAADYRRDAAATLIRRVAYDDDKCDSAISTLMSTSNQTRKLP
jgi:hypothetical protein